MRASACILEAMKSSTNQECSQWLVKLLSTAHELQDKDPARCFALIRLFVLVADHAVQQLVLVDKSLWLWSVCWLRKQSEQREFGACSCSLLQLIGIARGNWEEEEERWA